MFLNAPLALSPKLSTEPAPCLVPQITMPTIPPTTVYLYATKQIIYGVTTPLGNAYPNALLLLIISQITTLECAPKDALEDCLPIHLPEVACLLSTVPMYSLGNPYQVDALLPVLSRSRLSLIKLSTNV